MGHFDCIVRSVDLHPASLSFLRGNSGPWRALCAVEFEDDVLLLLLLELFLFFDVVSDPLVFSKEKGFYLYHRSFDFPFDPVDVGLESSSPGKTKNESVFS
jgi:hypothetical protein